MNSSVFSIIQYKTAREDGPICQRCDQYYALTGEFHAPTDAELDHAVQAANFAHMMLAWWEKDKPLESGSNTLDDPFDWTYEDEEANKRKWDGTVDIAKWAREYLARKR